MTKEEFKARLEEQEDWAPGWDAIEEELDVCIPARNLLIMEPIW